MPSSASAAHLPDVISPPQNVVSDLNHQSEKVEYNLRLNSTVADLPLFTESVASSTTGDQVADLLNQRTDLPGVLVYQHEKLIGLISRRFFLEKVGRYYGVEVYMGRPVEVMLKRMKLDPLVLPTTCTIPEAANRALTRDDEFIYEPIIIEGFPSGEKLLDFHTLLLAQSQLLMLSKEKVRVQKDASDVIRKAGSQLIRLFDLEQILDQIPNHLDQLLDYDRSSVFLIEEQKAILQKNIGYTIPENGETVFELDDIFYEIIDKGQGIFIPDTRLDERFSGWNNSQKMSSFMGLPISQQDEVIGFLTVAGTIPGAFDQETVNLTQLYLNQVSAAIQNARMYEAIQKHALEMESLHNAARSMLSSLDLDNLFKDIVRSVEKLIPRCQRVYMLKPGNKSQGFEIISTKGNLLLSDVDTPKGELASLIQESMDKDQLLRINDQEIQLSGKFISRATGEHVLIPVSDGLQSLGVLAVTMEREEPIRDHELRLLNVLVDTAAAALRNSQLHRKVQNLAVTDDLTGLVNRRGFYQLSLREVESALRYKRPLSAIMVDIDDFKDVNDTFGHQVGDHVIERIGDIISSNIRTVDICCRYGGEEFMVLLPESRMDHTRTVAERIRKKIAVTRLGINEHTISVSVSLGAAEIDHQDTEPIRCFEKMLSKSDQALYQAKRAGKNQVVLYSEAAGNHLIPMNTIINKDLRKMAANFDKTESELQIIGASRREIEGHLSSILKHASEAIISTNQDGKILIFNQSAEKMFRCPGIEAKGRDVSDFLPNIKDEDLEIIQDWENSNGYSRMVERGQSRAVRKDGEEFPIEISRSSFRINQEIITTVIVSDITARQQAEEKIRQTNRELSLAYDLTIEGWAKALELRDLETHGHCSRVVNHVLQLANYFQVEPELHDHIRRGALLHDIGKIAIPDSILLKPGPLTEDEWQIMYRHPLIARDLLEPIDFLKPALSIPLYHHEKFDGSGYPFQLSGDEIPFQARLFAVVDVWDALKSSRPYRPAWTDQEAREYLYAQSGKHFDPDVVTAFLKILGS